MIGAAVSIPHPIVASQVGAGFRGSDDVVGANGIFRLGHTDLEKGAAQSLQLLNGRPKALLNLSIKSGPEPLFGNSDLQTFDLLVDFA